MRRSIAAHGTVRVVPGKRMVHLTTASSPFHARVLVARLGAEGIVTTTRGGADGTYPLGGLVEVLVEEDDAEVARSLLRADAEAADLERRVDAALGVNPARALANRWLVGLTLGAILVVAVVGFLAHLA
jgi:hypothetical protein